MSNKDQEVVVYLIEEQDIDKPIKQRTIICLCSTVPEVGQQMERNLADQAFKEIPPPANATEEEKRVYRDVLYLQAIGFRASEQLPKQMPGKYQVLRVAVVAGPMAGSVVYSASYPTHIDPAKIREMESGMELKAEYPGLMN